MKAEPIESSLHSRIWSFNRQSENVARHVVLLTDGTGEAEIGDLRFAVSAPAILWLGNTEPGRLRVEAGGTGFRGWASDAMVVSAIGDQAESVGLHYLVERSFVLSLSGQDEQARLLERCFLGVLNELRQPMEGSQLLLSALLRIMLVSMIRVSGGKEMTPSGIGEKNSLLQRFRQLVEMNFRGHWSVAQYADALGITTDRLHAICTTGIGKSPKALISERLAHEAALRLERSSLTIQQLGHALGFNDPGHFSSFFRRMTGMPPGRYRKQAAASRLQGVNAPTPSFADWP
jgi:AraC family transcriptional activator of pobA